MKTCDIIQHRDNFISDLGLLIIQVVSSHISFKRKCDFRTYPNERTAKIKLSPVKKLIRSLL